MKRFTAGSNVAQGFYWNIGRWELASIGAAGGTLPGQAGDRLVKVPLLAALAAAPLFGLVLVVFLPFIGVAMVAALAVKKVMAVVHGGATSVAATVAQSTALPGEAYLTGAKHEPEGEARKDAEVEQLSREVSDRRADKK
jgi:hypothetical protein